VPHATVGAYSVTIHMNMLTGLLWTETPAAPADSDVPVSNNDYKPSRRVRSVPGGAQTFSFEADEREAEPATRVRTDSSYLYSTPTNLGYDRTSNPFPLLKRNPPRLHKRRSPARHMRIRTPTSSPAGELSFREQSSSFSNFL